MSVDVIKKFDEGIKNVNSYDMLLTYVVKYMFSFFCILFMSIHLDRSIYVEIYMIILFAVSVSMHVRPYVCTRWKGTVVFVYHILADTQIPVDKEAFLKVRMEYLMSYGKKVLLWGIAGRSIMLICCKAITIANVLSFVIWLIITAIAVYGWGYVYIKTKM